MSLLTAGYAGVPLGENRAGGGVFGSTPPILTGGLGRAHAKTAHPTRYNTPIMSFSYPVTELVPGQTPGSVRRSANGSLLDARPHGDVVSPERDLASDRPYSNYGTTFGEAKVVVVREVDGVDQDVPYEIATPSRSERLGLNGDLEYATWNGDPSSMYNARSLTLYTPEYLNLSPRSMRKLRYLLTILRPAGVVVRLIRGKDHVLLDEAGEIHEPDEYVEVINGVRHRIKRDRRFDVVSLQTYSGMGG